MLNLRHQVRIPIEQVVNERQAYHDYLLSDLDKVFLIETLTDLIFEGASKFIEGAKKYQDQSFILDVDHESEVRKESIDAIFYTHAIKFRSHHVHSKRRD